MVSIRKRGFNSWFVEWALAKLPKMEFEFEPHSDKNHCLNKVSYG